MPTYVYRREDGSTFEFEQSIKDDPLTVCPTTGQPVTRVISGGTGLIFKGSGFYLTDYVRSGDDKKKEKSGTNGAASSESSTPEKPAKESTSGPDKSKSPATGDD